MMRLLCLLVFIVSAFAGSSQKPAMKLIVHKDFPSEQVETRRVDVYLPEGYPKEAPYQVLYMHDGQNLSDTTLAHGGKTWGADKTVSALIKSNEVEPTILVGIWNTSNRYLEYAPIPAFTSLSDSTANNIVKEYGGIPFSDRYLSFIVEELKPFIDKTYKTNKSAEATTIAGSSMGGLISLYAICRYPDTFGSAACVSTHWPILTKVHDKKMFQNFSLWLRKSLPADGKHRIYFDYGTIALDSLYEPYQLKINEIMNLSGFSESMWTVKKYEGAEHNEAAWERRFADILRYALKRD
ncbi:MAG: alpha/beta hydrolase-fold protein [Bacteroidia bacterium]